MSGGLRRDLHSTPDHPAPASRLSCPAAVPPAANAGTRGPMPTPAESVQYRPRLRKSVKPFARHPATRAKTQKCDERADMKIFVGGFVIFLLLGSSRNTALEVECQ